MPGPGAGPGRGAGKFLTDEELANRPKVTKELLLRVFSYLKPYAGQLGLTLVCIAAGSVLSILPSVLTGRMIDEGLIGKDLNRLLFYILLSLGVTLASNLIGVAQSYLNTWIAQHISFDMRCQMYRHLQKMSQRFFASNSQGDIITRMTSDISGVESVIASTFTSILSNIITLAAALTAMYQKNWVLATVGIVIVPLFSIPTRRAGKTRWSLTAKAQEASDEINGILSETLSPGGQLLMRLFGRQEREYERYENAGRRMVEINIRESMAGRWFRVVLSTITSVGPMLLYLVGGILMIRQGADLTVGDITVLVALLGRMYGPVNSLFNLEVDWIRSMALFTRIFGYLDLPIEIENKEGAIVPKEASGEVRFEHVRFSYEPEREILKDVSFTLPKGHSAAIVGPSGSGKSTLVNLIPRLYDVTGGAVYFDGIDVRDLDLAFLRGAIGVVTQETYLFSGTIRDNLLYVREDATEEELEDACRRASLWDLIQKQEKGLDTLVGNRGLKLSGGEKQRLSIARVLLKKPSLLIFDEATASLDSISEARIQEAIQPLIRSCTSILIAHRLSTILSADEILVLKDGVIAERGTHEELIRGNGVYRELYETQFGAAGRPEEPAEEKKEETADERPKPVRIGADDEVIVRGRRGRRDEEERRAVLNDMLSSYWIFPEEDDRQ